MLNVYTESLLQKIATELAFVLPSGMQGLDALAEVFAYLQQDSLLKNQPDVQQDVARSLEICQQAMGLQTGVTQGQLDELLLRFERVSSALYLAPPLSNVERPVAGPSCAQVLSPTLAEHGHVPSVSVDEEAGFVLQPDADLEMLNEFCTEGRDLLHQVEQGVLVLEENPGHADALNQLFRAFHNFKGGAGFLGIDPIRDLAHMLESVLDAARRKQLTINRDVIELILAGGDALKLYVDAIDLRLKGEGLGQAIVVPNTLALLARAQACLEDPHHAPESVLSPPLPVVSDRVHADADLTRASSSAPDVVAVDPLPYKAVARQASLAKYVKLDTRKLDALVDLMGELAIAQSMVVQHPLVQAPKDRNLDWHLRQLSRITTDLQHNTMSLRMVPIRSVMEKMTRLVRDLASSQNKQIQLHLSGEDTELDRKIVEDLADPLLHMMRNAVDHGIESPAEREACGKSALGHIHLQASHQGGGIQICIRDDGKGLDAQKILRKAMERGLVAQDNELSEKEILQMIFLPGFSTADRVTEISGRGVGMDVVRGNINKLRGRVDIDSVLGRGTSFKIFLPLTLAIIDAMLVGVGPERFLLPILSIRESLRPKPGMVFSVQGQGEVIRVRDKLIPLTRLADKLDLPSVAQNPCHGIVVVVDSGGRNRALLVDTLIGKQEVVIKSLGEPFKHQQGMSGAAILGDGRVALIIDPDAIGQWSTRTAWAA